MAYIDAITYLLEKAQREHNKEAEQLAEDCAEFLASYSLNISK